MSQINDLQTKACISVSLERDGMSPEQITDFWTKIGFGTNPDYETISLYTAFRNAAQTLVNDDIGQFVTEGDKLKKYLIDCCFDEKTIDALWSTFKLGDRNKVSMGLVFVWFFNSLVKMKQEIDKLKNTKFENLVVKKKDISEFLKNRGLTPDMMDRVWDKLHLPGSTEDSYLSVAVILSEMIQMSHLNLQESDLKPTLSKTYITDTMAKLALTSSERRNQIAKKLHEIEELLNGPNEEWSGMSPDKCHLCEMPIVDVFFEDRIRGQSAWAIMCLGCHEHHGAKQGECYILDQDTKQFVRRQ